MDASSSNARKRTASMAFDADDETVHKHQKVRSDLDAVYTRNQQQSPLFRLPSELRNRIYEYALGGYIIEFAWDKSNRSGVEKFISWSVLDYHELDLPALWRVCPQLNCETALLPYSLNTWQLDFGVPDFYDFLNSLTDAQREAIREVRCMLGWMSEHLRSFADHLEELEIDCVQRQSDNEYEDFIPLKKLTGLQRLVLDVRSGNFKNNFPTEMLKMMLGVALGVEIVLVEIDWPRWI